MKWSAGAVLPVYCESLQLFTCINRSGWASSSARACKGRRQTATDPRFTRDRNLIPAAMIEASLASAGDRPNVPASRLVLSGGLGAREDRISRARAPRNGDRAASGIGWMRAMMCFFGGRRIVIGSAGGGSADSVIRSISAPSAADADLSRSWSRRPLTRMSSSKVSSAAWFVLMTAPLRSSTRAG
jgi:hypothetical protein